MELSNFEVVVGSAPILRFRLLVPEDVTDWTTQFTAVDPVTKAILYQANGTITSSSEVPNSDKLGVFDVPLTKVITNTWKPKVYNFSFWRTNVGFEDPLAHGAMTVKKL